MWVRSQNKMTLMDATTIRIYYDGVGYWRIYCDQKCIAEEYTNLGTYSSHEKALKVLDMIEQWINSIEYSKTTKSCRVNYVFQMPQDDEVK